MAGTHTGPVFSSKINSQPVVEGEHETRGASPPMRSAILGSFALSQLAPIVARRLLLWGIGLGTWQMGSLPHSAAVFPVCQGGCAKASWRKFRKTRMRGLKLRLS